MRIWSLHPKYLDRQGLLACWREALLAKNVLEGKTKGYKNHPQLNRFKEASSPIGAINFYLFELHKEATRRGYKFDSSKFNYTGEVVNIDVTKGQLMYEAEHLRKKLEIRDPDNYFCKSVHNLGVPTANRLFNVISGDVESWERHNKDNKNKFLRRQHD